SSRPQREPGTRATRPAGDNEQGCKPCAGNCTLRVRSTNPLESCSIRDRGRARDRGATPSPCAALRNLRMRYGARGIGAWKWWLKLGAIRHEPARAMIEILGR